MINKVLDDTEISIKNEINRLNNNLRKSALLTIT